MKNFNQSNSKDTSRRSFLKTTSAAAITGGTLAAQLGYAAPVHAAGSDLLKVALIGCGGRGTSAAVQALKADKNVKLTVLADLFENRLQRSLKSLSRVKEVAKKIDVPVENQFVGFDAYEKALATDVDVVLLTTPPHFRPMHFKAAIAAGKHVFAEKPVAVDSPGVRSVLKTCAEAKKKNLSVVSGLCLRSDAGFIETIKRLHDGAIGEIHTMVANDYRGRSWVKPQKPDWSDMYWHMRNWYNFTWLSGDFNVEQHVHYLDICAWVIGGYPQKAIGMGGRQTKDGKMYGDIFDHHSVTYEYENGAQLFSNCRQQSGCANDSSSHIHGSEGQAEVSEGKLNIKAKKNWEFTGKSKNMYQVEHDDMFAAIRSGQPINNGEYMAKSTLLAIMGRMATYTGKEITWEQAMESEEDLTPKKYVWGPAPNVKIAVPGVTKYR